MTNLIKIKITLRDTDIKVRHINNLAMSSYMNDTVTIKSTYNNNK